jgi:hypothetical protein
LLAALALTAPSALSALITADSFPHARHASVQCLVCHLSRTGEKLTFVPPRGCVICHHQEPTPRTCIQCHERNRLPDSVVVPLAIGAAGRPVRQRHATFRHDYHADIACSGCHGVSLSRSPVDSALTCRGCHDKHHTAGRTCAVCHRTPTIVSAHARPVRPHVRCDACHPNPTIAALTPSRSFCLACHSPTVDHNPEGECVTCHLQSSPEDYRARLVKPRRAG